MKLETARQFVLLMGQIDEIVNVLCDDLNLSQENKNIIVNKFNEELYNGTLLNAVTESMDEEEAQYVLSFYSTPIGKRLLKKLPETSTKMAKAIESVMYKIFDAVR